MSRSLLGKRTRQFLVFLHVAISLCWMGAGASAVVLTMTAWQTDDLRLALTCYQLLWTLEEWLIIPGAFSALGTGVLLSLLTPWGLTKYWWVLVKLVLTCGIILYSTFFIGAWGIESAEALEAGATARPFGPELALGPLPSLVVFLFMTWASVAKPWGKTPWARRSTPTRAAVRKPSAAAGRADASRPAPVPATAATAAPSAAPSTGPSAAPSAGPSAAPREEDRGAAMA